MEQTKCKNNGFTYVNTPGTSVVDYCLISYKTLDNNQNFEVSHVSHLLNVISVIGSINSDTGKPDLSYLTLDLKFDQYKRKTESKNIKKKKKKGKRKVQGVPQSQTAALPRPQEEEETDKSKQAQTEQTYEKH